MEIRKSNSVVPANTQQSTTETEKSVKGKSIGIASLKDSFEVSSSSNQENSGTKQLGANQQQEASKMNYKDFGNNGTSSQNSRPTYEDAKNSGLAARLGHNKEQTEADSKRQLPNGVTVADIKNSTGQTEQSSAAVKDAQQKLNGGRTNYRESLDQELARRRQDFTMHGGSSAIDNALGSRPDINTTPKGKGSTPTGMDAVAYSKSSDRQNADGSTTHISDIKDKFGDALIEQHQETTKNKDGTRLDEFKQTQYKDDNSKVETSGKSVYDAYGKLTEHTDTTTTTDKDGNVTVSTNTITKNADGSTTTNSTETTKPSTDYEDETTGTSYGSPNGNSKKMPGIDDRGSGNIPDDIKKGIEYDMQQIRNSKPKSGGETELTDGGVTGNSADGSVPVSDAFTRTGGVMGAVAQPTRAGEYVGGPSNGTVGSAIQNGGATDSLDGSSWTGTTHQEDPADVQFGPAEQPKEQTAEKKNEDSNDSSFSYLDPIHKKKA